MKGQPTPALPSPWELRINLLTEAIEAPASPGRLHSILSLRVREDLKQQNPEAYTPICLFLGFLSRPDPHQHIGLDKLKVPWARQFLAWRKAEWKEFVHSLDIDVAQVHAMYDIQPAQPAEVVTNVLALDAIFLTLLLLKRFDYRDQSFSQFFGDGRVVQLEQCGSGATWTHVHRDAFLMDNQLPLTLVHRAFKSAGFTSSLFYDVITVFLRIRYCNLFPDGFHKAWVIDHVIRTHVLVPNDQAGDLAQLDEPGNDHLLYYLLKLVCYVPSENHKYQILARGHSLSSASVLHRHGIQLTEGRNDRPLFIHQMRFENVGSHLLLPSLAIYNHTEVFLRNLAACEQKNMTWHGVSPLASYLCLMGNLMNTPEDVHLLSRSRVICSNTLGSDSEACGMWNEMTRNLVFKQSRFYTEVIEAVNARENSSRDKLWTEFREIYFGRPWYTVSFLAAFVLLGLTVTQTVYAMLAYYKQ